MWKMVHQVPGAEIRTCDLSDLSLLPLPLDQGDSRPYCSKLHLDMQLFTSFEYMKYRIGTSLVT